jgi:hypothetical protein
MCAILAMISTESLREGLAFVQANLMKEPLVLVEYEDGAHVVGNAVAATTTPAGLVLRKRGDRDAERNDVMLNGVTLLKVMVPGRTIRFFR